MNAAMEMPVVLKTLQDIEEFETVPLSSRNLPVSTYELICRAEKEHPERVAIRYIENGDTWALMQETTGRAGSTEISYRGLAEKVRQTANLFRCLGVRDTDSVSMVLPNVPEAHFVLWGGEACGVVNPINYLLEAAEVGEIVHNAGSRVLVLYGDHPDVDIWRKLPEILKNAPCIEHVLVVGGLPAEHPPICQDFTDSLQSQPGRSLIFERDWSAGAPASMFHTGGTTGAPRLAVHTHGNEVFTAWAINSMSPDIENACYLTGLPLFHCNAAIATGLAVFLAGGTVLLAGILGYRSPGILNRLYRLIEQYRVTNFSAVPTVYGVLAQLPCDDFDLSSLRFAACGAAPMPVDLFNAFQKKTGVRLIEGYGLTEATVCSSLTPPASETPRIGSIGLRLPYTRMKAVVLGDDGSVTRNCAIDEVGTLVLSGPSVGPGYADAEQNRGLFAVDSDGTSWLNTGDLARQDEDGYFWLTGRAKDLIIRGGHNIDPGTIEELLASHPAVNLAAAVGRPDKYAGEVPVAYVDTHIDISAGELLDYCARHIGERAAIPKSIIICDQLPMTGVGKIHKPTLVLRELEYVVHRELASVRGALSKLEIETRCDPKYGNTLKLFVVCANNEERPDIKPQIEHLIGLYGFRFELEFGQE